MLRRGVPDLSAPDRKFLTGAGWCATTRGIWSIVRRFQSTGFVPRNLLVTLLLVHQGVSSG